jgi:hypothetical protein
LASVTLLLRESNARHVREAGSVLKVEMTVASKGLAINKTNAYGKCRVTYLYI